MLTLANAFGRAIGQLGDPAILKVLAKSIALTIAAFVACGFAAGFLVDALFDYWNFGFGPQAGAIVGILLTLVGGWLLFRLVALAVIQFFADEVVLAVERKHYPDLVANIRNRPFVDELRNSVRSTVRALGFNLLALILSIPLAVTAVGPPLVFFAVNSWLLGRELQDMVWLRHHDGSDDLQPLGRARRLALGGVTAGLLAIPFLNLVAPVLGAAAATHLVHRRSGATP
ncbi:EI24 domain-containing protein [Qipengyuania sp. JC766]|uniref:EI24 domain-containing protein n=1 Tax=Qipengyuania sp. JC766 TaxID=3232139 RepID=UPI003457DFA4